MKKTLITITLLFTLLFSFNSITFSQSSVKNLKFEQLQLYTIQTDMDYNIISLKLINDDDGNINTFKYYDTSEQITRYIQATYYYDYENDLLIIIDNQGNTVFSDLNL